VRELGEIAIDRHLVEVVHGNSGIEVKGKIVRRTNPVVFARSTTGRLKNLHGCVYCSVPVLDVMGLMKAVGIDRDIRKWALGRSKGQKATVIGDRQLIRHLPRRRSRCNDPGRVNIASPSDASDDVTTRAGPIWSEGKSSGRHDTVRTLAGRYPGPGGSLAVVRRTTKLI
jgi:hypothetical protein